MASATRLHRLYAVAAISIWVEAVLALLWLVARRRPGDRGRALALGDMIQETGAEA
jgi:hypothetical protein